MVQYPFMSATAMDKIGIKATDHGVNTVAAMATKRIEFLVVSALFPIQCEQALRPKNHSVMDNSEKTYLPFSFSFYHLLFPRKYKTP